MKLKLSDFDYALPRELIAQTPARPRNHARLLVYDRASHRITDDVFYSLDKYLPADSTLVFNNSKVEKCRLDFGSTEIFVLRELGPKTLKALVRPGRKFRLGSQLSVPLPAGELVIDTLDVDKDGIRTLRFNVDVHDPSLEESRRTPFPPYIQANESLGRRYQTVYARQPGSKASPTAGLHFTRSQIAKLAKNHPIVQLTLHVGMGTFAPIKSQDPTKHTMHAEEFSLGAPAAATLNRAKHITAVGTTTARTLESLRRPFKEFAGSTNIFITPDYRFKNTDALITNFHLPKSTLLMLVAALVGTDELQRIYSHAIKKRYRFYSFGDAMLIL